MLLKDKVVIVTGAAKGIGLGSAKVMAAEGASVTLTDIDERAGEQEAHELREKGYAAGFRTLDQRTNRSGSCPADDHPIPASETDGIHRGDWHRRFLFGE